MNSRQLAAAIDRLIGRLSADSPMSYRVKHDARGVDLLFDVDLDNGSRVLFVIELCADPRAARIAQAAEQAKHHAQKLGAHPVVAVPRLGGRLRDVLRERGVGFLSLDGKVSLRGGGVLIDRVMDPDGRDRGEPSAPNLYADKSSRLLRHLLSENDAVPGVRELARRLDLSPGLVSRVLAQLRDVGYLSDAPSPALLGRDALLDEWVAFYRRRARRQVERRFYLHARGVEAVLDRLSALDDLDVGWGLSFHAGASRVAPYAFFDEVHVLIGGASWERDAVAFAERAGLEPAVSEANVVLVSPYYKESWEFGMRRLGGLPVVSDVQLFLDLSVYPRRGPEQAERIRERLVHIPESVP